MPGYNRELVTAAVTDNPDLSNYAIAKLVDVSPHTIAKIRRQLDILTPTQLRSRARGLPDKSDLEPLDRLPDGGATVYHCYGVRTRSSSIAPLLYIGSSLTAMQRLAKHSIETAWYREVSVIHLTHYRTVVAALKAEKNAIRSENPIYNKMYNLKEPERDKLREAHYQHRLEMRKIKREKRAEARLQRQIASLSHAPAELQAEVASQMRQQAFGISREAALQRYAEAQEQAAVRSTKPRLRRPRS